MCSAGFRTLEPAAWVTMSKQPPTKRKPDAHTSSPHAPNGLCITLLVNSAHLHLSRPEQTASSTRAASPKPNGALQRCSQAALVQESTFDNNCSNTNSSWIPQPIQSTEFSTRLTPRAMLRSSSPNASQVTPSRTLELIPKQASRSTQPTHTTAWALCAEDVNARWEKVTGRKTENWTGRISNDSARLHGIHGDITCYNPKYDSATLPATSPGSLMLCEHSERLAVVNGQATHLQSQSQEWDRELSDYTERSITGALHPGPVRHIRATALCHLQQQEHQARCYHDLYFQDTASSTESRHVIAESVPSHGRGRNNTTGAGESSMSLESTPVHGKESKQQVHQLSPTLATAEMQLPWKANDEHSWHIEPPREENTLGVSVGKHGTGTHTSALPFN